ncbi:hypothetical protein AMTRI_Chr13g125130 [Amborella trichopoda]
MALSYPKILVSASVTPEIPIVSAKSTKFPLISASVTPETPRFSTKAPKLPPREIPGSYGLPILGPISDRLDYFKGRDEFFKSRMQRYQSTVYRTNMPPGPPIASDPRCIVLLDGVSFPVLFDNEKVEKKDLFTGTYMPSVELTGGYRVLSYLDVREPSHSRLKRFLFGVLEASRNRIVPEFSTAMTELFSEVEDKLSADGKADFNSPNQQACFNFLARALLGHDPAEPGPDTLGKDAPTLIQKWVAFQLYPILSLGLPTPIEEVLLRTTGLPTFLVKNDYERLFKFFNSSKTKPLEIADELGIDRVEASHNLLFATCFNTWGGLIIVLPGLMKWVGRAGATLHRELAQEVRAAVQATSQHSSSGLSPAALAQMPLVKSCVYEALRIEPPVPTQYGRARKDLIIDSHISSFRVRAGEMLCGYQPFATRDPLIFDRPEEFVAKRFMGEEGEKMLNYLLWSNGKETEDTTENNKQCAGKDFVVMVARLFLAELFLRYDSFDVEISSAKLGSAVAITSLKRATF